MSRRGYLDRLGWAAGLTRHAEDAIRFPDWLRLVGPVGVPFFSPFLDCLVLPCSGLTGVEDPLKDEYRADVHADPVGNARLPVYGHLASVYTLGGRVRVAVPARPRLPLGPDLVAVMLPRNGELVWLGEEVRVNRLCLLVHLSDHYTSASYFEFRVLLMPANDSIMAVLWRPSMKLASPNRLPMAPYARRYLPP